MRICLVSLSFVAMTASAGFAQGSDWTGAYGGLVASFNTGTNNYMTRIEMTLIEGPFYLEGKTLGAFGGYLWGTGKIVYGAEAEVSVGKVYEVEQSDGYSYEDRYQYERFYDLKGRFGYIVDDFLIYGTLGVSRALYKSDIGEYENHTNSTGTLYGLGVDYKFSDRYFGGVELLRRNFDFYDAGQGLDIPGQINTLTLRVGMAF